MFDYLYRIFVKTQLRRHLRKGTLCGTKRAILDQLCSHVRNSIVVNTAQGATKLFSADAHGRRIS